MEMINTHTASFVEMYHRVLPPVQVSNLPSVFTELYGRLPSFTEFRATNPTGGPQHLASFVGLFLRPIECGKKRETKRQNTTEKCNVFSLGRRIQRFRPDRNGRPRVQQLQWLRHGRNTSNWVKHLTSSEDDDVPHP